MNDAMNDGPLVEQIAQRVAGVRQRIAAAGGDSTVQILGVTKTQPIEVVRAAVAAGVASVGESYVQEMTAKFAGGPVPGMDLHVIGHLQSNKVRQLLPFVAVVSSVDRMGLVRELAARRPGQRVLVQVNTTGEASKSGCEPGETEAMVDAAAAAGLRVEGLMTIGPTAGAVPATRAAFAALRRMVDALGLTVCSMGMTDDFEIAVGEGSTQVRLGTALFGVRPRKPPVG